MPNGSTLILSSSFKKHFKPVISVLTKDKPKDENHGELSVSTANGRKRMLRSQEPQPACKLQG